MYTMQGEKLNKQMAYNDDYKGFDYSNTHYVNVCIFSYVHAERLTKKCKLTHTHTSGNKQFQDYIQPNYDTCIGTLITNISIETIYSLIIMLQYIIWNTDG